jgi:hypothetical protein
MATSKRLSAHREAVRVASDAKPDDDKPLNPDEPGDEDGNPPKTTSTKEKPMDDETKAALDAARTEGRDTGFKSANDRMNAVFASEHYAGREAAAAKMLGKPNLSAEDIVDLLADMPKAEPQAAPGLTEEQQREAAEEAGRKEMKAALEETSNSQVDASTASSKPDKRKAADGVWDRARAKVEARRKGA